MRGAQTQLYPKRRVQQQTHSRVYPRIAPSSAPLARLSSPSLLPAQHQPTNVALYARSRPSSAPAARSPSDTRAEHRKSPSLLEKRQPHTASRILHAKTQAGPKGCPRYPSSCCAAAAESPGFAHQRRRRRTGRAAGAAAHTNTLPKMAAIVFKVGVLALKTVSKPLADRFKNWVMNHPNHRQKVLTAAQV